MAAVVNLKYSGLTIPSAGSVNNAASKDRNIAAAGSRSAVPLTYGEDRLGALILNVLPAGANSTTLLVQCLWGFALDGISEVKLNERDLPAGSSVTHYTGSQVSPDAAMVTAFAAQGITYTDALTGYGYSVVSMPTREFDGQLNVTAKIRGRKVYDPRKDSTNGGSGAHRLATPSTWEWSDNPALADADFLYSTTYGAGSAVDWSSVITAANANDSLVGGEKRRLIGVSFISPTAVTDIAEALRAYAGCWHVPTATGIKLLPDVDGAAVATYAHSSGDIASMDPLTLQDTSTAPTVVEVVYTDTSAVPWRDASAFAQVAGAGSTLPWRLSVIRLPGIKRYSQALREAIERLNKLRLGDVTTTVEVFDNGIRHDTGDIIALTHPAGLSAQKMRVDTATMTSPGRWRLSLIEHDAASYSDSVVAGTSAPLPSFINPAGPPSQVTGFAASPESAGQRLRWNPNPESDVTGYELRRDGTGWDDALSLTPGAPTIVGGTAYLWAQPSAGNFTLRIKAIDSTGLRSNTNATLALTVGDIAAGTSAYNARLTRPAAVVSAANDGTVADFSVAGGTMEVSQGGTILTSALTFSVVSSIGVTIAINSTTGAYTVSAMSADTGTARLRAVVTAGPTLECDYTIAKSKAGSGEIGNDALGFVPAGWSPGKAGGAGDFIFYLDQTAPTVLNAGEMYVSGSRFLHPDGTERTAGLTGTILTNYGEGAAGRFYLAYSQTAIATRFPSLVAGGLGTAANIGVVRLSGATWQAVSNTGTTATWTPVATDCILAAVEAATSSSGLTSINIFVSGAAGQDGQPGDSGAPAIGAVLSNEAHTFPATETGAVTSTAGATTTMNVSLGGIDDTSNWTFSSVNGPGVDATRTANSVTVNSLAAGTDVSYVDITAARAGFGSVTKRFTLAKAKAGAQNPWVKVRGDNANANTAGNVGRGVELYTGYQHTSGTVGHTLIVFNPATNAIVGTPTTYNTTGSTGLSALSAALVNVAFGHVVTLYTFSASGVDATLRTRLEEFGSALPNTWTNQRVSHAFIGMRGLETGQAYEAISSSSGADGVVSLQAFYTVAGIVRNGAIGPQGEQGIQGVQGIPGIQGPPGITGPAGQRGSVDASRAIAGTAWSDAEANTAISNAGYGTPVRLDRVTLYNGAGTYTETRYWSGTAWLTYAALINGNLIVRGSVVADALSANSVTTEKLQAGAVNASKLTISNRNSVFPDPGWHDRFWWGNGVDRGPNIYGVGSDTATAGYPSPRALRFAAPGTFDFVTKAFPIELGAAYRYKVWIYVSSTMVGSFGVHALFPQQSWFAMGIPRSGTTPSGYSAINVPKDNAWHEYTGTFENSAALLTDAGGTNPNNYSQFRFSGAMTAGDVYIAIEMVRASGADLVVDGAIQARHLEVGSVRAQHILVKPKSLNMDPDFALGSSGWTNIVATYPASDVAVPAPCPAMFATLVSDRDNYMSAGSRIPVVAGEKYRISCWVNRASAIPQAGIIAFGFTSAGVQTLLGTPQTSSNTWAFVSGEITIPSGVVSLSVAPWNNQSFGSATASWFADLNVEKMTDSTLMVDGAVLARHLTVGELSKSVNGGLTSGARVDISTNRIDVYDGVLASPRVRLGLL